MIFLMGRPAMPTRLGQLEEIDLAKVVVVDVNGRPVGGARVTVTLPGERLEPPVIGETDSRGFFVAKFRIVHPPSQRVEVVVDKDGYSAVTRGTIDEGFRGTLFVKLPVCLPQPILTPVELGSFVAGLALTAGGLYWKFKPAELIGEVLVGASAFTAIYRHSCM